MRALTLRRKPERGSEHNRGRRHRHTRGRSPSGDGWCGRRQWLRVNRLSSSSTPVGSRAWHSARTAGVFRCDAATAGRLAAGHRGRAVNSAAFSPDRTRVTVDTKTAPYACRIASPASGRPSSSTYRHRVPGWSSVGRTGHRPGRPRRHNPALAYSFAAYAQLATTVMLVTAVSGIAAGWCAPATLSRTTPPSADCKMPQTVLPRLVTCR